MTDDKITVKPEIDRLINIVEKVKKGRLVVPEFQRDYVWDKKQRIELFDSIKKGFPIGSLLFWNPEENIYQYNDKIGPYKLNSTPNIYSYIIDGYQRLTTLFSSLINPNDNSISSNNGKKLSEFLVYYDLENEEFVQQLKNTDELQFIPLYTLIDTIEFLKFSEKLKNNLPHKCDLYIERGRELATILMDYSIAFVNINGGSIQESVEIFSRINSKGSDMSPMWMLSALTYNENFKFSDEIDRFRYEQLSFYNFEDLKTEILLQCIETATGKIYFDVKTESLARRKDFEQLCHSTFQSVFRAIEFLYHELNVVNYKLLPYNLQLIFITEYFRNNPSIGKEDKEKLKAWFWKTTYSNYFSVYSLSKQRKAFVKFQKFSRHEIDDPIYIDKKINLAVSEFPKTIYFGSVRSKALALFLIKSVVENNPALDSKDLDDFYSLNPPIKDAEYLFPKFQSLDYHNSRFNNFKKIKDYSFIMMGEANNFDYKANFIDENMINNPYELGKLRYEKIKNSEMKFVESLGDLETEAKNDSWKY